MAQEQESDKENDKVEDQDDDTGEIEALIDDVQELLHASASLAGEELEAAREKLARQVAAFQRRRRAARLGREAQRIYRSALDCADECARRRPWELSVLAMVGGILLGACLSSCGRRG
jgi:ElaB/YqjD/DUF883 family membrane-anchored ribosome-binding protein